MILSEKHILYHTLVMTEKKAYTERPPTIHNTYITAGFQE